MPYNLIVASDSPVLKKLCQSVFPEGNYQLYLAASLDEVNRFLDSLTPEAVILEQSILDSTENALSLNNRLAAAGRVPVFLVTGTFEPLAKEFIPTLRPEQVFHKPFYSESLATAIKETIEKIRFQIPCQKSCPRFNQVRKTCLIQLCLQI